MEIENYYRNSATVVIYWGLCLLVLMASVIFLLWGDWESAIGAALIFALMLTPAVVRGRYRLYLPFALEFGLVVFTFLTLFLGGVAHFYEWVPFWDKFLHVQSGLLLGGAGYVLVYILNEHERTHLNLSPGFVSFFAVTFSLTIGVVWEIFEFGGDVFFKSTYWQGVGISDTMWDLIADGSGALIVSIAGYFWMYRHKRLPFTPWPLRLLKGKLKNEDSVAGQEFI